MKNNPFDTIAHWLSNQHLTASEKRDMREVLMNYATTHPVKSGLLSPYTFRYIGVAFASLVLVLSGSIGLTYASTNALPNQSLYSVKLWVEEFQAKNQKTPEAQIAFETNRIKTRFNEATTLAVRKELNETTSQIIQAGLEHSRESVRTVAESILNDNPELALRSINNLETSFSSNARILATIEQNTSQNIGTIVLAAQLSTERLALEKVKFEQVLALQPNTLSKNSTEQKLSELTEKLKLLPVAAVAATPVAPSLATELGDTDPAVMATTALFKTDVSVSSTSTAVASASTTSATAMASSAVAMTATELLPVKALTADELVAGAVEKIKQGAYSEALVSLQKAEQVIDEANLTRSLERTYNITTTR